MVMEFVLEKVQKYAKNLVKKHSYIRVFNRLLTIMNNKNRFIKRNLIYYVI